MGTSRSTQTGGGRQAGVAADDVGKSKNNRYLCHSELKCNVGEVSEDFGHSSEQSDEFSKGSINEKVDFSVNVNNIIHVFTSSEGVIANVFDECAKGLCTCNCSLHGVYS